MAKSIRKRRNAFERWARLFRYSIEKTVLDEKTGEWKKTKNVNASYTFHETRAAWDGWQAACEFYENEKEN